MLLSIIVPFFNAEKTSKRLLETLKNIKQKDVELILINDGSTDNTYTILENFKSEIPNINVMLIDQNNKGPGGARNSGLKVAKGDYVWFVDCDDDIKLEAIDIIRDNVHKNYDFIDFNIIREKNVVNSMNVEAGEYNISNTPEISALLLNNFGHISSKVIRRELINENEVYYPEYCVYEDNPLRFIYPFFIKSFLKSEVVSYIYQLEFDSVTRSKPNLRTLDRLYTAEYGLNKAIKLVKNNTEMEALEEKFIEKFLIEPSMKYFSIRPSTSWVTTWRIMKQYRDMEKKYGIKIRPTEAIKATKYHPKVKSYLLIQWKLSRSIRTNQTKYFENIRKKAWNL